MTIRAATADDLAEICGLHLANWREAYRHLLPDATLRIAAADYLAQRWAPGALDRDRVVLSRDAAGRLAGFVAFRAGTEGGLFVDNLHVGRAARGRGLARALMAHVAEAAGDGPVWLTVLDGNLGARAVYRRWGGAESPPYDAAFLGLTVRDRRVVWPSGHALATGLGPA